MVIKINPVKPGFNQKLVWGSNDFSGGRTIENSQTATNPTQGSIYLNADFAYNTHFNKRAGFREVLLCEGTNPLIQNDNNVKLIWIYNGLEEYNSILNGLEVRPYQFIVIQQQPKTNPNSFKKRKLLFYDVPTKTYKPVMYKQTQVSQGFITGKMTIKADTSSYSGGGGTIDVFYGHEKTYTKDLTWTKIHNRTTHNRLEWDLKSTAKDYDNNEIKIFFNKEKINIRVIPTVKDRAVDTTFFVEQENLDNIENFKQVLPYYTNVKEEEVIGWNLALTFWKTLNPVQVNTYKNVLNWGNADQGLGPKANIINSMFANIPANLEGLDYNRLYKGIRTNSLMAMPGNKIFNSYAKIPSNIEDEPCFYWSDSNFKKENRDIQESNYINFNVYYESHNNYQTLNTYLKGTSNSASFKKNPQTIGWRREFIRNLEVRPPGSSSWLSKWKKDWMIRSSEITFSFENLEIYLTHKILKDWFIFEEEKKYKFEVREPQKERIVQYNNDKELFNSQFVSMGYNDEAYIDQSDLVDLMDSQNTFTWRNFLGILTPSRLFFSMPQLPNYIPHNFDYTPPLEFEDDNLQDAVEFYNQLILFSKYKIFKFAGQSPSIQSKERLVLKDLNNVVGAYAKNSIQNTIDGVIFFSKGGVRKITKTYEGELNTKIIDHQLADILSKSEEIDEFASSCLFNLKYYLFLPSKNQFFISNVDFDKNIKGAWTIWESPLIDFKNNKYFNGFYPNHNTNELLLIIDNKLHLQTEKQWYDGKFDASNEEQQLYDCIFQSVDIQLQRDFHKKKIKKIKFLAYTPGEKGVKLFVDAWGDGFKILSSEQEIRTTNNGYDETKLEPRENLEFDAGSFQNIEGSFDNSKLGYDKIPMKSIRVSGIKAINVKIKIRNTSNKNFILKALGVEYKYKASK